MKTLARSIAAPVLILALTAVHAPEAQTSADREAVRSAALDYVEGVYNVQPERIKRSVHPSLDKRGFSKRSAGGAYAETTMTFDQLVNLAANWNKEGKRDTTVKKVEVLDVLDQTAVAKVTASWGVDYMLLGKYGEQWQIQQILWQSPPPEAAAAK